MDLKEENAIGGDPASHWYYIAKGRAIKSLLGEKPLGRLLDVGAGSGVFSKMLVGEGHARDALCVDPHYSDEDLAAGTAGVTFTRDIANVDVDTVLMIDVLEHVDDDVALLRDYIAKVPDGTRFMMSVPAFQFLWSGHDDYLDHRRRYTLARLRASVEAAGLQPIELRYFFGMLLPAVAALRLASRAMSGDKEATASSLKATPKWLNKSLVALHDFERAALFPVNKLGGVSVFCLAEKKAGSHAAAA